MGRHTYQVGFDQSAPPAGERFTKIVSGDFHTCGLRENGAYPTQWKSRHSICYEIGDNSDFHLQPAPRNEAARLPK